MNRTRKVRKLLLAGAIILAVSIVILAVAIIQYYSTIKTIIPVEQAVWVDGRPFNETIVETLSSTYGGCTVYSNHTLENRGDVDVTVLFEVVNITDGKGNPINPLSGIVEVSFLVNGQPVDFTNVPAHSTVNFQIAIHFHYAIAPDVYTIITQIKPNIPEPSEPKPPA